IGIEARPQSPLHDFLYISGRCPLYYNHRWAPLVLGEPAMTLTVEAIYENGVLRPTQPLLLKEHAQVRVTIRPASNWVRETYGICGWKGSTAEADRFASDPELDFPPPAEEP